MIRTLALMSLAIWCLSGCGSIGVTSPDKSNGQVSATSKAITRGPCEKASANVDQHLTDSIWPIENGYYSLLSTSGKHNFFEARLVFQPSALVTATEKFIELHKPEPLAIEKKALMQDGWDGTAKLSQDAVLAHMIHLAAKEKPSPGEPFIEAFNNDGHWQMSEVSYFKGAVVRKPVRDSFQGMIVTALAAFPLNVSKEYIYSFSYYDDIVDRFRPASKMEFAQSDWPHYVVQWHGLKLDAYSRGEYLYAPGIGCLGGGLTKASSQASSDKRVPEMSVVALVVPSRRIFIVWPWEDITFEPVRQPTTSQAHQASAPLGSRNHANQD